MGEHLQYLARERSGRPVACLLFGAAAWQRKHAHPIHLLETFVEAGRFAGTCYQGANWIRIGQTQGRTRQGRDKLQEKLQAQITSFENHQHHLDNRGCQTLVSALRASGRRFRR